MNYKIDLNLIDKSLYLKHEISKNDELVLIAEKENLMPLLEFLKNDENLKFRILADICGVDYLYNAEHKARFCVIYNLLSLKFNKRIFIKIFTNEVFDEPKNHEMNYGEKDLKEEKGIFQKSYKIDLNNQEKICEIEHENVESYSKKIKGLVNENVENYSEKNGEGIPSVYKIFSSALWLEREIFDMFGIKFYGMEDRRRLLTDYGFKGFPLRKDFPLSGYKEVYYDGAEQKVLYKDVNLDQEYRNFDFKSPWQGPEVQKLFHEKIKESKIEENNICKEGE